MTSLVGDNILDVTRKLLMRPILDDDLTYTTLDDWIKTARSVNFRATGAKGEYHVKKLLVRTRFSKIYIAEHFQTKVLVIVKIPANTDRLTQTAFNVELEVLQRVSRVQERNVHVVKLLDVARDATGRQCIILEYCPHGSLRELVRRKTLSLRQTLLVGIQLSYTLCKLYEYCNMLCHCDIKPENILVCSHGIVKLSDFNTAKLRDYELHVQATSQHYTPPEVKRGAVHENSDVYSLGVLLYELITGELPRRPISLSSDKYSEEDVQVKLRDIISSCLEKDPSKRPSMYRLCLQLTHLYIKHCV